jgi:hypothetical protein
LWVNVGILVGDPELRSVFVFRARSGDRIYCSGTEAGSL